MLLVRVFYGFREHSIRCLLFFSGFGFAIIWMALKEAGGEKGFFKTYFAFLDHLLGRGCFFLLYVS